MGASQLAVLLKEVFRQERFLHLVRDLIVFGDDRSKLDKKGAGYHQFHAVQVAVAETFRAAHVQAESDHVVEEALRIRDDAAFFQAVRAAVAKRRPGDPKTEEELDQAIRQIVSRTVAREDVVDLFAAAGLQKPAIFILSDEFLAEVQVMEQKNLAVELLRKLLTAEIRTRRPKNLVQARSFAERLEQAIRRYQNRAITAAQVIGELIAQAKHMRAANRRGEVLRLGEDELAFYEALGTADSAVKLLGDEDLRAIARELVTTVRNHVTSDLTLRENVRAQLRVLIKRILRKHGYPPDKQEKATQTVREHVEVLCSSWIGDN